MRYYLQQHPQGKGRHRRHIWPGRNGEAGRRGLRRSLSGELGDGGRERGEGRPVPGRERARARAERGRHGVWAKVGPGVEARDSLLKHNVNKGGDAACGGVVDPITKGLGRIAHEHTTERFKIHFATLVVRGFGKGSASEHTECYCV
jgi:hypothetical protein